MLKINNIDPNSHQVKDEMKRLEEIYGKIKELDKKPLPGSNLNKEAADTMIKNVLSMNNNVEVNRNNRKLIKNVPEPELPHIAINKFK